jgi:hypothetical protein
MFSKLYLLLKKIRTGFFFSADKGNCVVVMDKHDYREKALSLLNNRNTYSILKSDPTGNTQRGLNAKLLLLKKSNIISKATYEKLYSSDGLSPRFYDLKTGNSIETYCEFSCLDGLIQTIGNVARVKKSSHGNHKVIVYSSAEASFNPHAPLESFDFSNHMPSTQVIDSSSASQILRVSSRCCLTISVWVYNNLIQRKN